MKPVRSKRPRPPRHTDRTGGRLGAVPIRNPSLVVTIDDGGVLVLGPVIEAG